MKRTVAVLCIAVLVWLVSGAVQIMIDGRQRLAEVGWQRAIVEDELAQLYRSASEFKRRKGAFPKEWADLNGALPAMSEAVGNYRLLAAGENDEDLIVYVGAKEHARGYHVMRNGVVLSGHVKIHQN